MKKIIITVFLITTIITGIAAQAGMIRELTGDVELKRAGEASFTAASAGDSVARDTIISTGFRSTAIVVIGSAVITVRPLTRLSLAEIQSAENTENIDVNLQTGRIRVDVKSPAGTRTSMNVQSPSATASVRGTSFWKNSDGVEGIEGKVLVRGTSGPGVILTGKNATSTRKDGRSSDPAATITQTIYPASPQGTFENTSYSSPANETGNININVDWEN
jgi:hypothetical protein